MISPPSGVTVSQYWNAIKNGNRTHVQMDFTSQDIILEDEDIDINIGVTLTDILNGDTDLLFGKAVMKQVTTRVFINEKTRYMRWNDKFTLKFGVEINGSTKWATVGYFIGERPNNVETLSAVDYTAYDEMQLFNKLANGFSSTLTFPCKLGYIFTKLCDFVGLTSRWIIPSSTDVPIINRQYNACPFTETNHTCRELLALIAEACGRYACIRNGNVQLEWYTDHTADISITKNEEFNIDYADLYYGIMWNEFDTYTLAEQEAMTWDDLLGYYTHTYGVSCVRVRQENLGIDVDYPQITPVPTRNVYMIIENPFLNIMEVVQDREAYVKPLFEQLDAFGGRLPVRTECIGNWLIESGDIITVQIGNETIDMPVYCKTMTWNGSVIDVLETTGKKDRDAVSPDNKQKILNTNMIGLYVEDRFYKKRSGIDITFDGIDITANKNVRIGVNDNEKWIYDNRGLALYNYLRDKRVIEFGNKVYDGAYLDTETGVYTYTIEGDTTHGRLAFIATDSSYPGYNILIFEHIGQYSSCLYTVLSCCDLGKTTNPFKNIYATKLICDGVVSGEIYGEDRRTGTGGQDIEHSLWIMPDKAQTSAQNIDKRRFVFVDRGSSYSGSGNKFYVSGATSNGLQPATYYGETATPSSKTKKHDIQNLPAVGKTLDKLNPVSFVYNDDLGNNKRFGLIYEDTVDIVPEICQETKVEGNITEKAIDYAALVPLLLKEIQDLRKRVAELEKEVGK